MIVETEALFSPRLAKMETSIRSVRPQNSRGSAPLADTVDLSHEALLVISSLLAERPVAGEIQERARENAEYQRGDHQCSGATDRIADWTKDGRSEYRAK